MANVKTKSKIDVDIKINLELSVAEAEALNALTQYGTKEFLEVFYKHLGKAALQPHERGLISLFSTINQNLPSELFNANEIIAVVKEISKD